MPDIWISYTSDVLRLHRLTYLRLHDTLAMAIPLDCQRFFLSSAISRRFRGGDCAVVGEIPLDFLDAGTKRSGRGTFSSLATLRTSWVVSWVGKVFLYFTWFGKKDEICDFIYCTGALKSGIATWKRFRLSLFRNSPRVALCSYCIIQLLLYCSRRWKT